VRKLAQVSRCLPEEARVPGYSTGASADVAKLPSRLRGEDQGVLLGAPRIHVPPKGP
jgi:hypothetical protein